MKNMIYTVVLVMAGLSAVPVTVVSSAFNANAESVCEFTTSSATTGGAIQQQIDAIARCNARMSATVVIETPSAIPTSSSNLDTSHSMPVQETLDPNRAFCPSIPRGASAEEFQYQAALERCKHGSR